MDDAIILVKTKKNAIIIFYIELENKAIIRVIAYNKIADKCYRKLEKDDTVWIEGFLENKNEMQIIINKIKKQSNYD